uniref:Uncharacterized protein n=1 Tax=Anguilla anguilla TaxID=7936 RepID=A0A0E9UV99_ANGAN
MEYATIYMLKVF